MLVTLSIDNDRQRVHISRTHRYNESLRIKKELKEIIKIKYICKEIIKNMREI